MKSLNVLVPGGNLHTRQLGSGRALLCLHGGPGASHEYLAHGLGRLSGRFRQVHFDQRGGGKSTPLRAWEPTFDELIRDIDAVCDAYRIETLGLVGHSWGATLALAYALTTKRRVTGLALINALPLGSDWAQLIFDLLMRRTGSPAIAKRLKQVEASLASVSPRERESALGFAHRAIPLLVRTQQWHRLPNYEVPIDWQGEIWAAATRHIERYRRELPHDTLLIQGDQDAASTSSVAETLRGLCTVKAATLNSCGHVAPLEASSRLCALLEDYFSSTTATSLVPRPSEHSPVLRRVLNQ